MPSTPYHHGSLPAALLDAAEAILARDGPDALTLRGAARAAGVSHAAPAHHFGDLTGLMSELAAIGYGRFAAHLAAAANAAPPDARERMIAMGRAYVAFAREHHNMFRLMFRAERLDRARPALEAASKGAFAVLRDAVNRRGDGAGIDPLAEAIGSWSLVHGFAMLLIDRQLPPSRGWEELLDAVLRTRRG